MPKFTKSQLKALASMPTFDDFLREYYTSHPEELASYKQTVLDEYIKDPTMTFDVLMSIFQRIAELEGYTKFAKRAKLTREHVYRALKPGSNPTLSTLKKLADSCGMRLGLFPK